MFRRGLGFAGVPAEEAAQVREMLEQLAKEGAGTQLPDLTEEELRQIDREQFEMELEDEEDFSVVSEYQAKVLKDLASEIKDNDRREHAARKFLQVSSGLWGLDHILTGYDQVLPLII